jgi:hypothetical protein
VLKFKGYKLLAALVIGITERSRFPWELLNVYFKKFHLSVHGTLYISVNEILKKGFEVFVVKVVLKQYLMSLQKCGKRANQVEQRNKQV